MLYMEPDILEEVQCVVCDSTEPKNMVLCDHCGLGQHRTCLGELMYSSKESFFCKNCGQYVYQSNDEKARVQDYIK